MPTLSKLVVKLEAESAKLHTELDRANRKLSKLGRTAQRTNRTLTGAIAGMSRAVKGFIAIYAVNQLRSLATAAVDAQSEIRNLRLGWVAIRSSGRVSWRRRTRLTSRSNS